METTKWVTLDISDSQMSKIEVDRVSKCYDLRPRDKLKKEPYIGLP